VACEFPQRCGNLANCYTLVTYLLTAGGEADLIYLVGNVSDVSKMIVQRDTVNLAKYCRSGKLCR